MRSRAQLDIADAFNASAVIGLNTVLTQVTATERELAEHIIKFRTYIDF